MSRQELAELVNAWAWNERAVRVEIDANYLGKLERGVIGWPSAVYREALRAIPGVPDDGTLGFVSRRRPVVRLTGVDSRGPAAVPVADGDDGAALELVQRLRRTSLDRTALDDVRLGVDRLCTAYASEPGEDVRARAERWLAVLGGLRDQPLTYRQHREVLDLAGWLTLLVSCLHQDAEDALARGRELLTGLAYPDNPRNHFTVDPAKYDFYAMDCHRSLRQDDLAWGHAEAVLRAGAAADGTALSPMRMAEAELTQAVVLARAGDVDAAMGAAGQALARDRRSVPHLLMVGRELAEQVARHRPAQARELARHLTDLCSGPTA